MSVYNTGAVTVKVGSSEVIGNGTAFTSNVVAGFYFKLTSSSAWYELATVNSATKLQLSTRYSDTNYITTRASEYLASLLATPITATKVYSGILDYYPVIQSSVSINASIEIFTDESYGVLVSNGTPPGSGTINYDTGAWTIITGTVVTGTTALTATYSSGNTLTTMPYQIVTDYTLHYKIPELSLGDTNIPYIYTKAMRTIDAALYNASMVPQSEMSTTGTLTSTQCRGGVIYVTASALIGLPSVANLPNGSYVTIYCTVASLVSVDPNVIDRIRLNGVALDDGDKIESSESIGDFISLHRDSTSGWTTIGRQGTWVDGGV